MERKEITYDEFMSYPKIKPGVVHIHEGIVYKHSPNSFEIISEIDRTKGNPLMKSISIPTHYLYTKEDYFGFTYQFNRDLHLIEDALYLGIIKDINTFISELLKIIEKLNKMNMCYWDFHRKNIYSNNEGNPFMIDVDDIKLNPKELNLYHQAKYLTEFILNIYLNQEKTVPEFRRNFAIQTYLSTESLAYLDSIVKRNGNRVELPYIIIDELSNPLKRELIKSKIK